MSKHSLFAAALAFAALTSMSGASQAHDCLGLHRMKTKTVSVVDGTVHAVRRMGDRTARFGDRVFGWMWCGKRRV
jgi:hypothetical protein